MDEASLPIDIQCRKLLDWLISRRICNREWHDKICKVNSIFYYSNYMESVTFLVNMRVEVEFLCQL